MMLWVSAVGITVVSYVITRLMVPYMISIAERRHIVDHPDGCLKLQKKPTPYLGGIAVYLGWMSGLALFCPVVNHVCFAVIGATLLLFVGLVDDLLVLSPLQKWWGQVLATCCFVRGGFYLKEAFITTYAPFWGHYVLAIVSAVWILTIINAFNLIDVMDGLATTVALCITASLCLIAYVFHAHAAIQLLLALGGALLAFLMWNKPTARIYLGDAGSLCIGGILAIVPFMIPWGTYSYVGFLTPVIIFFVPLIEVCSLIVIRTAKGIPWYCGSPDHFCLYLKRKGWRVGKILKFVAIFSVPLLLLSLAFACGIFSFLSIAACGIMTTLIWGYCIFSRHSLLVRIRSFPPFPHP